MHLNKNMYRVDLPCGRYQRGQKYRYEEDSLDCRSMQHSSLRPYRDSVEGGPILSRGQEGRVGGPVDALHSTELCARLIVHHLLVYR